MKRYKRLLFVCIAACSLFLGGCGETLHELTAEEEAVIVHYAAYAVAKHNIQQKDGVSNVYIPEDEMVDDSQAPEDTQSPEDGEDIGETQEVVNGVKIADAIGHGSDLTVTYEGYTTSKNYVEDGVYAVDAAEGKIYYIMNFTLTNVSDADVSVENLTKNMSFKLVSGDLTVTSMKNTFAMRDLSSYVGTIPAGQSVETVLLFEISEDKVEGITEPSLQIIIGSEAKNVIL